MAASWLEEKRDRLEYVLLLQDAVTKQHFSFVVQLLILCVWSHLLSLYWFRLWNCCYLSLLSYSPTCCPVLMKANRLRSVHRLRKLVSTDYEQIYIVQEEKKRKLLKVRLEMAKFLQETIAESGFPGSSNPEAAQDFSNFFRKVDSESNPASKTQMN